MKSSIRYIFGIDQSLTSSGICLIDTQKKEILHTEIFKTTPFVKEQIGMHPSDFWSLQATRLSVGATEFAIKILNIMDDYHIKTALVVLESPTASQTNSQNTIYLLGAWFLQLKANLDLTPGIHNIVIPVATHRKVLFQQFNKQMKKNVLFDYHWDTVFGMSGYLLIPPQELDGDDLKDAFSLAYCGDVYAQGAVWDDNDRSVKQLEAIRALYCSRLNQAKACAGCYKYATCKKKEKTKQRLVRHAKEIEELQKTPFRRF